MDEIFNSQLHYQEHTGVLTHKLTQPTEDLILARNARLRNSSGVLRDLGQGEPGGSWARLTAVIPFIMYEQAKRDGFMLNHKDPDIAARELNKFLRTPAGKACMVQGD